MNANETLLDVSTKLGDHMTTVTSMVTTGSIDKRIESAQQLNTALHRDASRLTLVGLTLTTIQLRAEQGDLSGIVELLKNDLPLL